MKLKEPMMLVEWLVVAAIVLIILMLPMTWVVRSHFEAKAYNRLTGAQATTWDAMWVELRVSESPK